MSTTMMALKLGSHRMIALLSAGCGLVASGCTYDRRPNFNTTVNAVSGGGEGSSGAGGGGSESQSASTLAWLSGLGAQGNDTVTGIAVDDDGNVAVCGYFQNTLAIGAISLIAANDGRDIFVAKLDRDGKEVWAKSFGESTSTDNRCHVAMDADGSVIVAGQFETSVLDLGGDPLLTFGDSSLFLGKLDRDGKHVWSNAYGNLNLQRMGALDVDSGGNIVIVGDYREAFSFDTISVLDFAKGIFVASVNSDGVAQWSQSVDGTGSTSLGANGVSIGGDGYAYVVGNFDNTLTAGATSLEASSGDDAYVMRIDGNGSLVWLQPFGGPNNQLASAVAVDSNGDALIGGHFVEQITLGSEAFDVTGTESSTTDIYLAKLDSDGGLLWAQQLGDASSERLRGLASGQDDRIAITGEFEGGSTIGSDRLQSQGDEDLFVALLDSGGGSIWSESFGDTNFQGGNTISIGAEGAIAVGGRFETGLIIDADTSIASQGNFDGLVMSFSP